MLTKAVRLYGREDLRLEAMDAVDDAAHSAAGEISFFL